MIGPYASPSASQESLSSTKMSADQQPYRESRSAKCQQPDKELFSAATMKEIGR